MGKDPAFLFYTADFTTGTVLMTDEQVGKYIRALCHQHQKGHISEKDMMKICKSYDEDIFEKFRQDDEGRYYNERLDKEVNKRAEYANSRRNNRLSKKNDEDSNNICGTYVNHMSIHMENENENINRDVIEVKDKRIVKEKRTHDFLDEVIDQFTEVYEEVRGDEYLVTNRGKERAAAGKLLAIYKAKNPDQTAEETLAGMRGYFARCAGITDQWLYDNMSLTIINSKLNEINTILRNGNQRRNSKGGATDAELAAIVAKHFGK